MPDAGKPVLDEPGLGAFLGNADAESDDLLIEPLIELFAGFQAIDFAIGQTCRGHRLFTGS